MLKAVVMDTAGLMASNPPTPSCMARCHDADPNAEAYSNCGGGKKNGARGNAATAARELSMTVTVFHGGGARRN